MSALWIASLVAVAALAALVGGVVVHNRLTRSLHEIAAEARRRERELQQAQKMEGVGQLATGVAHDFNNILTAIHGYAELLLMDLPEQDDPRRENVLQILRSADSAGALTRQLLLFSRKQVFAPKLIHVGDIVRGIEPMLKRLIGEDIELVTNGPADLWPIEADPGQIEQVVMNLVVNARDAMAGGGRLSIDLENAELDRSEPSFTHLPPGPYVSITVSDTGSGMDADTLARAFEPFFTTKEADRGTGLGLAMVYGIVERSGGAITVNSEPNWGAVFRMLLPRATGEPDRAAAAGTPDVAGASGGETVLLVEDDGVVRQFAREVLEREGYHVLEAARGHQALTVAAGTDRSIDLLLTDVVMPGMNGYMLWQKLMASHVVGNVLFVSGYGDEAVVRHRIRDGGLPFLEKPFTYVALTRAVHRALGRGLPAPKA